MKFVTTFASGREFDFEKPAPEMFCLRDIAHHLSRESRWGGNVEFASFTVAQHALLVAQLCRLPQSRPYALLHDTVTMVTKDLPAPFKAFLCHMGADVRAFERLVLSQAVYPAFNLPQPTSAILDDVRQADKLASAIEHRDIVAGKSASILPKVKPVSTRIRFMAQPVVEEKFLLALQAAVQQFGKAD